MWFWPAWAGQDAKNLRFPVDPRTSKKLNKKVAEHRPAAPKSVLCRRVRKDKNPKIIDLFL